MIPAHLALLLALGQVWAPTTADGDGIYSAGGSPVVFRYDAPAEGIYTGPFTATTGQALTFSRASSKSCIISGVEQTATTNQLCAQTNGTLIEPTVTNYFLNSDAPATQTISVLSQRHHVWVEGSGSLTVVAGTATDLQGNLPCTVTSGVANDCQILTTAGTIVFTVVGSLTFTQVEGLSIQRTSKVHTAGTAVQRVADTFQATNPLSGQTDFCVSVRTVRAFSSALIPPNSSTMTSYLTVIGAGANRLEFYIQAFGGQTVWADLYHTAVRTRGYNLTQTAGTLSTYLLCNNSGVPTLYQDGVLKTAGSTDNTGDGKINFAASSMGFLQNASTGNVLGGELKQFLVCNTGASGSCK